ncbi:MAG: hypothetical protein K8I27_03185 [Planctomycetes bacterium]|nr:hypothetical protein [Planctomycetota bacterium]
MRLAIGSLLLLLLAACGNGDNAPDNSGVALAPFTPDFSSPGGATEAYQRAIEDQDEELMKAVLAAEEHEAKLPTYLDRLRQTKKEGLDWILEFKPGEYIDDDHVVTEVTYVQVKSGVKTPTDTFPIVFMKVSDGTWRFSSTLSRKLLEEAQRANQPPDNSGEAPGNHD